VSSEKIPTSNRRRCGREIGRVEERMTTTAASTQKTAAWGMRAGASSTRKLRMKNAPTAVKSTIDAARNRTRNKASVSESIPGPLPETSSTRAAEMLPVGEGSCSGDGPISVASKADESTCGWTMEHAGG